MLILVKPENQCFPQEGVKMANESVKVKLIRAGVRQFELAKALGISETTLYRRLREELPRSEQKRLVAIIDEVAAKR